MTVSEPLPSEFLPFGHVVGRVIRAVGDTPADPDADPEAIPVTGTGLVRFTPLELTRVVTGTVPSTWVQQETIAADLDSEGFLSLSGARGLLLWPGAWKVSAGSSSVFSFPTFTIEVTSAHTADAPLDLWTAAPYSPPAGATVTTLVVPQGQQPGQTLGWDGTQLAWVTPTITPTATTLAAGSNATAAMSGSWPNLTLGLGIPAGQPSTYQIVGVGRPDVQTSMTTDVKAQVAAAPVGSTFTSTDGASVGAWEWQKRPTGWTVTNLDTEWRNITSLLSPALDTMSTLMLRRINRTAFLWGKRIRGTAAQTAKFTIPSEFAPLIGVLPFSWGSGTYPKVPGVGGAVTWNGVDCTLMTDTGVCDGVASWPVRGTAACPTTLPGTPTV